MKAKLFYFTIHLFLVSVTSAYSEDFFGASVVDREAPSSLMLIGMYGDYPIVDSVVSDSPAKKAGFTKGDIIISINYKVIKKTEYLAKIKDDILVVEVFDCFKWRTLTIDRLAIKAEKAHQLELEQKAAADVSANSVRSIQSDYVQSDTLPPLKFDDSSLSNVRANVVEDRNDNSESAEFKSSDQSWSDNSNQDFQGIDW